MSKVISDDVAKKLCVAYDNTEKLLKGRGKMNNPAYVGTRDRERGGACQLTTLLNRWRDIQQLMIDALGECTEMTGPPELQTVNGSAQVTEFTLDTLADVTESVEFAVKVLLEQLRRIQQRLG